MIADIRDHGSIRQKGLKADNNNTAEDSSCSLATASQATISHLFETPLVVFRNAHCLSAGRVLSAP
jgi:hypothetical protein